MPKVIFIVLTGGHLHLQSGLVANTLTVTRNQVPLLTAVNLQVRPGELRVILGPNGAGKTTLLQALVGLVKPSAGTVNINSQCLRTIPTIELAKRCMYLSQQQELGFDFSVAEIVTMGRYPYRSTCSLAQQQQAVDRALQQLHLKDWAKRPYSSLSGGERQRVQLARMLAQSDGGPKAYARYFLLDEYNTHLDIAHQQELLQLLKNACQQDIGIVAVLHDLNLAVRYADTFTLLAGGRVVGEGSTKLLTADLVTRVFGWPFAEMVDAQGHSHLYPMQRELK